MDNTLHILINDESYDNVPSETNSAEPKDPPVFSYFDVLQRPFIQVKDANQFDYLISALPESTEVAIWIHPNASLKKLENVDTPGEASMTALALKEIEFMVISRYPDDVSKELLVDINRTPIKLNSIYKEIKNAKTTTVGNIRSKGKISNTTIIPNYEHVDVAIIAALYEDEFKSLKEFLEDEKPVAGFETMKIAKLKNSDKKVLVDFQTKMGMVEATYLSTQILAKFSPKYLIMVGVCGGRATKGINLLDIIIPNKVFDYQTGKYEHGEFMPYLRACNINNKKAIDASDKILKSMEDYVNTPLKSKCKGVTIRSKTLACGNVVVKTDGYLETVISGFDEETEGVEMESFGVVRTTELLEDKKVTPIIIKSVMDFTEKSKTDKDKANAAYLSACFTYFLVKDHL
jgi:nucleoside phosphorylase